MKEHQVILSLGSNCGDRRENVRKGVLWVAALLSDTRFSDLYETEEIHGIGSPYYNAVVSGKCEFPYERLNQELKEYEIRCGRDAEARSKGLVPVDIDIVVWDGEVLRPSDFSQSFFRRGFEEIKN